MMEIVDPYFEDLRAKEYFSKAEHLALKAKISDRRFLYQRQAPNIEAHVWQVIHPQDTVITAEDSDRFSNINPDRIRYDCDDRPHISVAQDAPLQDNMNQRHPY